MTYWTSKLGNKYLKTEIEANDQLFKSQLDQLRRKQPHNRSCADCGQKSTVWASVNIGVFLCIRCGSIHRGIGTHISIPKGCTGTYLWGPDEIERMTSLGNEYCAQFYGGLEERPSYDASDETWRTYIRNKYEHKKYMKSIRGEGGVLKHQQPQHVAKCNHIDTEIPCLNKKIKNVSKKSKAILLKKNNREEKKEAISNNGKTSNCDQEEEDFFAQYGL